MDAGGDDREFLVAPGHALELRCDAEADWLLVYTVFPFTPPRGTPGVVRVRQIVEAAHSVGLAADADTVSFVLSCLNGSK